jgi:fibronectin type 3 domain-containing protein
MSIVAAGLGVAGVLPTAHAAVGCGHTDLTPACTFTSSGTVTQFTVPSWVTSLHIDAVGGAGQGRNGVGFGDPGAEVVANLTVTSGATLYAGVGVGGGPGGAPAANGTGQRGGNGGGESDVRTCKVGCAALGSAGDPRQVTAGGGGGGGGDFVPLGSGVPGAPVPPGGFGGAGGGYTADGAGSCYMGNSGTNGTNGPLPAGGGAHGAAASCIGAGTGGAAAANGAPGVGGTGVAGRSVGESNSSGGGAGGGGGGGYFGGGGGNLGSFESGGGGGGAGSSFLKSGTLVTFTPAGGPSPSVTISYVPDKPKGPNGAAAPTAVGAGSQAATVTFTAPADTGGAAPITSYTITSSSSQDSTAHMVTLDCTEMPNPCAGSPISAMFTGLMNGATYTFTVTATNAVGDSLPSAATNSVTVGSTPSAPTITHVTFGNGQATVTWTAPTDNGGFPITTYTVTSSPGNKSMTVAASLLTATVTGLTNGTCYTFTVLATNSRGPGTPSAPAPDPCGTPMGTVPSAPQNVSAVANGPNSAVVSWGPPANDGGGPITQYTVKTYTGSPNFTTLVGTPTSFGGSAFQGEIDSLTTGTPYEFTVTASTPAGAGNESAKSTPPVTPTAPTPTTPGAPQNVHASPGNQQAFVSFTAPLSTGGSAITSYKVTSSSTQDATQHIATVTCSDPGSPCAGPTITGVVGSLINGDTYTFTVVAHNAQGDGTASAPSNAVVPAAVPGAPVIGSATPGDSQATVTWQAPTSNGGAPVTSYTVTSSSTQDTAHSATLDCTAPGNPCAGALSVTVTGLTNGLTYTFTVKATNSMGTGPASAPSNAVIPGPAVPSAPQNLTASAGSNGITLNWSAANGNGTAVTNYKIYRSTTSGSETLLTTVGNVLTYTDSSVASATTYFYKVTAVNANGESARSNEASATTAAAPTVPASINNLSARPSSTRGVQLSWTAPSNGGSPIDGYRIYRGTSSGSEVFLTTMSCSAPTGGTCTVTDSTAQSGTVYYYKVAARNAVGTATLSNEAHAQAF